MTEGQNQRRSDRKRYFSMLEEIKKMGAIKNPTKEQEAALEKRWSECKSLKARLDILDQVDEAERESIKNPVVPQKEKRSFSIMKVISALADNKPLSGYEAEVSQEIEKRGNRPTEGGIMVPLDEIGPRETRLLDRGQVDPPLVDDPTRQDLRVRGLYEKSVLKRLGVRMINASGPFRLPSVGAVQSGWFSGSGGSAAGDKLKEADPTLSEQALSPHYCGAFTSWSVRAIRESQSTVDLEMILREALSDSLSDLIEKSFFQGADSNQPSNFFTMLGQATNNKAKALSDSAPWKWTDFTEAVETWKNNFKNNAATPLFCMTNKDEKLLKDIQRFSSSDGKSVAESLPYVTSGHMDPNKLVLGAWEYALLVTFGNSAELSLGMSGDSFLRGSTYLRILASFDHALLRKEPFFQFTITRS